MPAPTPARARSGRFPASLALLAAFSVTLVPAGAAQGESGPEADTALVATGTGPLQTTIVVETLESRPGPNGSVEKRFVEAQRLKAGQEVHYTVRVTNPGKAPVDDVVVTKRLPFGVDYVRGSAVGPACEVEFSNDGGKTFEARPKSGQYTHVRWTFGRPLAPGATALLRFRAIFR